MESESLTVLYGPHSTGPTSEQQTAIDNKEMKEKALKDTHDTSNEADSETDQLNTCENIESESLTILVSPHAKGPSKEQQPTAGENTGKEPHTHSDYSSLNKNRLTYLPGNISITGDEKPPEAYVLSGVEHPYVTLDEKGTSKPVTFVRQMSCPEDSQIRGLYTAVVTDPGQLKPKKQSASPSPERDASYPISDTDKANRCLSFAVYDLKAKNENNADSDNEYADAMESHPGDRNSEREESPSDSDTSNFSWQREYIALLEEYNEFQNDMTEKQEILKAKLAKAEAKIMEIATVYKEEKRLKEELNTSKEHIKRLQGAVFELENKDRIIQTLADELSVAHGQIDSLHCKVKQLEDSAINEASENTVCRTDVSTQTEEEKAKEVFSNALYQDVPMDMFDVDLHTRLNDLKKSFGDLQKIKDDIVRINDKTELQLETCKDENRQWQTLSEHLQTISEAKDDVDSNRTKSEPTHDYFTVDDDLKKDYGASYSDNNVAHAETLKSKSDASKSEMCSAGDYDKDKQGPKEEDTSISPSRDVIETEDDSVFLSNDETKTNTENLGVIASTPDIAKETLRAERLKEKLMTNEIPMRLESKVFESVEDTLVKDSVPMKPGNEVKNPSDTNGVTEGETDKVTQNNNNVVIQENVNSLTQETTQTVIQGKPEETIKGGADEVPQKKIKEISPGNNTESDQVKPAMGQSYEANNAKAVDNEPERLVRATADKGDGETRTPAKKDGSVQSEHSGVDDELRLDSSSDDDTRDISRGGSSQNTQKKKAHRISDEYWVEYV